MALSRSLADLRTKVRPDAQWVDIRKCHHHHHGHARLPLHVVKLTGSIFVAVRLAFIGRLSIDAIAYNEPRVATKRPITLHSAVPCAARRRREAATDAVPFEPYCDCVLPVRGSIAAEAGG